MFTLLVIFPWMVFSKNIHLKEPWCLFFFGVGHFIEAFNVILEAALNRKASRVVGVRASPQGKWKFPAKFTGTKGDAIVNRANAYRSHYPMKTRMPTASRRPPARASEPSPLPGGSWLPLGPGQPRRRCLTWWSLSATWGSWLREMKTN